MSEIMSKIELFDCEKIYDDEISPLMAQIIKICRDNKIPMVASFAYHNDLEQGVGLCSTAMNDFEGRKIPQLNAAATELYRSSTFIAMTITES